VAGLVKIPVRDGEMDAYLGAPERRAPGPVIILMYHRTGIDDFTKGAVDRLVGAGYLVAVPDVYHRCPSAMPIADRKALLNDGEIIDDVACTIDALRKRADVDADRIVVMGHCMGGRMALLLAGSSAGFCAAVVYYGGGVMRSWGDGPTVFERLKNIRCPVIGFFGNEDKNPSPEEVDQIGAELKWHDVAHEFHRYPGVGHGFQNPNRVTAQERAAAEDAWTKALAFLHSVAPP
jgi:carboxymethylenebutenolidase